MRTYTILLQSLPSNYMKSRSKKVTTVWVRGVHAETLGEASAKACAMHPNLGCTPTTMSMGWEVVKGERNGHRRIA